MAGNICAAFAILLNCGMSRIAVCVDFIVCPFGNMAVSGLVVTDLCKHGAFDNRNCPVKPESTRDVSLCLSWGGVRKSSECSLLFLDVAPKSQSMLTWDPPIWFDLVASRWYPSFGYIQVWIVWVRATLSPCYQQ
jgi:hypothetical protein